MDTDAGVRVERVVAGGEGLGRLPDGRTVFVPGGLPGDVVQVDTLDDRGRWGRATAWTPLTPSPDRVEAACPHVARCGGCDWMEWSLPAQRAGKAEIVRDALRRTGGVDVEAPEVRSAGNDLGWRSRIRLAVVDGVVGFRERQSHRIVAIDRCAVANDLLNEALVAVRTAPPPAGVAEIELRADAQGVVARVLLDATGRLERVWVEQLGRLMPLVADQRKGRLVHALSGGWLPSEPARQRWEVADGVPLLASTRAFTQVHPEANRALVAAVLDAVPPGAKTFVDAYCGAGNFSLPLLARGLRGVGLDGAAHAVADADAGAEDLDLPGRFVVGDVARDIGRIVQEAGISAPDVLIVDPPRSGAKGAIAAMLAIQPRRVIYVACDPASLARDVASLGSRGWALTSVVCVDLFPHTHHVETVAVFDPAEPAT